MPRKPIGPQRDISLTHDDWAWLKVRAAALGLSGRSAVVRWLIAQDRAAHTPQQNPTSPGTQPSTYPSTEPDDRSTP